MAKKKFVSAKTKRFDVDFAVTNMTSGSTLSLGGLPANILIRDGWLYVKTSILDAGDESTTLSVGYTDSSAAFHAAEAISSLTAGVYLKLLPGVINIVGGQALTTVDTPAEAVALARASGNTFGGIVLTTAQQVTLTVSADHTVNAGTLSIWIEYFEF